MIRYVAMPLQLASSLLFAVVIGGAAPAQAQTYPAQAVKFISDSAPGSAIDTNLRIIAEGLSELWGKQVVIENRPGAGGAISATVASEALPDGYTLYAPALSVFLTVPGKAPNLPLKLPRDFIPIGLTADQPMSIGVNPKLGINTLPELIERAKKEPGGISYCGIGRRTPHPSDRRTAADPQRHQAADGALHRRLRAGARRYRRRPRRDGDRRLCGPGRSVQRGPAQGAGDRIGEAAAGPAQSSDRGGNAAGLRRRRLAGAWSRRSERRRRSCGRSATTCARCSRCRRSKTSSRRAAATRIRPLRPKPRRSCIASRSCGSRRWSRSSCSSSRNDARAVFDFNLRNAKAAWSECLRFAGHCGGIRIAAAPWHSGSLRRLLRYRCVGCWGALHHARDATKHCFGPVLSAST